MKKISSLVPVSWAVSLGAAVSVGAVVVSCWSFSDPEDAATPGEEASAESLRDRAGAPVSPDSPGSPQVTDPAAPVGASDNSEGASPALPLGAGTTGAGSAGASGGSEAPTPTLPLGAAGNVGAAGSTGSAGASGDIPMVVSTSCDVLAAAGNPCVAAHSTARVVFGGYAGPLYQVCRGAAAPGPNSCPGGMTRDIGAVAGGAADSAAQDTFCAGGNCTISIIYDQSPNHNDLKPAPAGGAKLSPDVPANATDLKTTLNGKAVYGVFIKPGMGYRAGCAGCGTPTPRGTAVRDEPETMYMVTTPNGLVNGCCFDYGNGETTSRDDGNGTMEALYFGGGVVWGTGSPGGHANGPWIMADLENGLYAGWENNQDQNISTNTPLKNPFIVGVLVGDTSDKNAGKGRFALYGGDATFGTLKTLYDGIRPARTGYVPMKKQGSIILGIGGDNSATSAGQWYEGVMASGAATLATVNALQANIVAAGYGK
jgi:non-reducing end alpha-L-arabinofuranosidase